jgi:hypothetical protein
MDLEEWFETLRQRAGEDRELLGKIEELRRVLLKELR